MRPWSVAGTSFVRVPSDSYDHIARALDCGADGIVVPMVGSAEQARSIVDKMKFTPLGKEQKAVSNLLC